LGEGHTDLAAKCAATTHALLLETPSLAALKQVSRSFLAFTTDMGTELGIPTFHGTVESMTPAWHPAKPTVRTFMADGDVHDDSDESEGQGEQFLPKAIGIPGMNHIIHYLAVDINHEFQWWEPHRNRNTTANTTRIADFRNDRNTDSTSETQATRNCILGGPKPVTVFKLQ